MGDWGWVARMAWRDSRTSRRRLLLYVSSISLGVASLVALYSIRINLLESIRTEAKSLLGADVVFRARAPFDPAWVERVRSATQDLVQQVSFSSMAYFPSVEQTRLVEVRAIEPGFPFYGSLETRPAEAVVTYQQAPAALLDETLMLQYGLEVGDPLRLGAQEFRIAGRLLRIPGEAVAFSLGAPRLYIPLRYLEATGLIQFGSRVTYRLYGRLPEKERLEALLKELEEDLRAQRIRVDTVEERQEELGRGLENAYRYLNLIGFSAFLLGGLGVASAIHLYLREKREVIAVLRCLGVRESAIVRMYLLQTSSLAVLASLVGALLGLLVQGVLPALLLDFLPVRFQSLLQWEPLVVGLLVSLVLCILFVLLPLLPARKVPPLAALRVTQAISGPWWKDGWGLAVFLMLLAAVLLFFLLQAESWLQGMAFFLGLAAVFTMLALTAASLIWLVRRGVPSSWPYAFRQGLANLHRPQNQTLVLTLALGLGTFLIATLYLVQSSVLREIELTGSGERPNLVFFDIQSDQKEEAEALLREFGVPLLQDVAIVTMRLHSVKGEEVRRLIQDPDRSDWPLLREYRSTYRDRMISSERLLRGTWTAQVKSTDQPVPVSLEERIARSLQVDVGDELVFDVQGVLIPARVGSIREVDWQRVQPNFFVVFPAGVLEQAPQFHVLVTRTEEEAQSARIQREMVKRFPNVSAIDLNLILNTVDAILGRVAVVIRFMGLFSILTGLVVLVGAVSSGRLQRIREAVLLRTLGASRRQVRQILLAEYLSLGFLAVSSGLLLALMGTFVLTRWLFEISFQIPLLPLLGTGSLVVLLTILVGMLHSRGICDRPPLQTLRAEV